jgi:hypothetical protein
MAFWQDVTPKLGSRCRCRPRSRTFCGCLRKLLARLWSELQRSDSQIRLCLPNNDAVVSVRQERYEASTILHCIRYAADISTCLNLPDCLLDSATGIRHSDYCIPLRLESSKPQFVHVKRRDSCRLGPDGRCQLRVLDLGGTDVRGFA